MTPPFRWRDGVTIAVTFAVNRVKRWREDWNDEEGLYRAQLEAFKAAEMIRPVKPEEQEQPGHRNLRVVRVTPCRRWRIWIRSLGMARASRSSLPFRKSA